MQLNDDLLWFYANYNEIGSKNHNNLRDIIYMGGWVSGMVDG